MDALLHHAYTTGYERMAAWSDLLDEINLYPVPDADTGRNLRISLSPLKNPGAENTIEQILLRSTGNSGNIAGAFFATFIRMASMEMMAEAAIAGKDAAWGSLLQPSHGTMLSVFDALSDALNNNARVNDNATALTIIEAMKVAVAETTQVIPQLKQTGVVDSGALGMFLFFEGFFTSLVKQTDNLASPSDMFGEMLTVTNNGPDHYPEQYCIDTVIVPKAEVEETRKRLPPLGSQIVTSTSGDRMKIHLHTDDKIQVKTDIEALGAVVQWDLEPIVSGCQELAAAKQCAGPIHIVTDGAGSLTAKEARALGITLMDSYIVMDNHPLPETTVIPEELYAALTKGARISTAQASRFERHQCYERIADSYDQVVYLCVGSAYTGNYQAAAQWIENNNCRRKIHVVDTGAASGRLGLIVRMVAAYAKTAKLAKDVVLYANAIGPLCGELIFIDQLKYLVAGGRLSKTSGFFGDLLHIKPVITPTAHGAEKIGVVRNSAGQIQFTLDTLSKHLKPESRAELLLQYTDNKTWVSTFVQPKIEKLLPMARVDLQPMSLTSGVHLGPGAWAVAYVAPLEEKRKE